MFVIINIIPLREINRKANFEIMWMLSDVRLNQIKQLLLQECPTVQSNIHVWQNTCIHFGVTLTHITYQFVQEKL